MKNKKLCKLSALVLAAAMVFAMIPVSALAGFSDWFSAWADADELSAETQATSATVTQPFISTRTFTSRYGDEIKRSYFRIPAIVTLDNGTIVTAADARFDTENDAGGIDTAVAYSTDGGESWTGVMANYMGDDGNDFNANSATFIDPMLATDGKTVWMLVDLYSAGYSNMGASYPTTWTVGLSGSGFTSDGHLKISVGGSGNASSDPDDYTYYLGDFDDADEDDQRAFIYDSNDKNDKAVEDYTVDRWFNLYKNGEKVSNLFYANAAYQAYPQQHLYLTKSEDGGATWSAPTLLDMKESTEVFYGVGTGSGCMTADGTIIFPCYGCETLPRGATSSGSLLASYIYSTDNGETWERSWDRSNQTFISHSSEATITEVQMEANSYLYAFSRYLAVVDNKWATLVNGPYYFSNDGGESWESKTDVAYSCTSSMGSITYSKYVDGQPAILLSAEDQSARQGARIYTYLVNKDGSLTEKNVYKIGEDTDFAAYSDLIELPDGSIGLLYESNTTEITFLKLDIQDIVGKAAKITEPHETVEDDGGHNISVTAPGLESVTATTRVNYPINDDNVEDVVAYDMLLNGGEYTDEALVQIPLPNDWTDYDTNRIYGFVEETDGSIETLDATVTNSIVTFTVPHFSTVGLVYLTEVIDEEPWTGAEETVTLTVGQTTKKTIDGSNYEEEVNKDKLDNRIATVEVTGADESKTDPEYTSTSVRYSALAGSNTSWTKTEYYYQFGNNYYPVYAKRVNSNSGRPNPNGQYTYYYGYSTTDSSSDVASVGYSSNGNNTVSLYTMTSEGSVIPASTEITFTGVYPGTTSVIVGNTKYTIVVSKAKTTICVKPGDTATKTGVGTKITKAPDSSIATAELENGTLTITGVSENTTGMETDTHIITITVANVVEVTLDNSPLVGGKENMRNNTFFPTEEHPGYRASLGKKLTKLTISAGLTFDVDCAENGDVIWDIEDKNIATVDENGVVTAKVGAEGETVLTATVNGQTYQMPVVVRNDGDYTDVENYDKMGFHFYFAEMTHVKVYYSVYCSDQLVEAQAGEVLYLITHNCAYVNETKTEDGELAIDFFVAPENDEYAVTMIRGASSSSAEASGDTSGVYCYIRDVDGDVDLGDDAEWWNNAGKTTSNNGSTGKRRRNEYTDAKAEEMLRAAAALGCDATMGYSQAYWSLYNGGGTYSGVEYEDRGTPYYGTSSTMRFRADRLPSVEKKVTKINDEPYTEGMKAGVGDVITFEITVNRYECANPIEYTNPTLTEKSGFSFVDNNDITKTIESLLQDSGNTESEAASEKYTVTYTIQEEDLDTTIENVVGLSYTYTTKYGAGSRNRSANVSAKISIPTFETQDLIVDFGLPVAYDYTNTATYSGLEFDTDSVTNNAEISGKTVTYTPTTTLLETGEDTVEFQNLPKTGKTAATYSFKVLPASNVLYEENFLTPDAANDTAAVKWSDTSVENHNETQTAEAVGSEKNVHGYDPAYASSTKANGYYQVNNLAAGKMSSALTTTFTGTGFDLIGDCGATTGRVMIDLKNQETNKHKIVIVDTRYNGNDGDNGVLHQVPFAHIMVDKGTYEVKIFAAGTAATTATTQSAVSTYSLNRTSVASVDPFERYLRENNITDVEYIVMNDVLNASAQSVSAISTYAAEETTTTLQAGTHVEIDAFRVYYPTDNESYKANERNVQYVNILEAVKDNITAWTENDGEYSDAVTQYEAAGGPQNEIYLAGKKDNAENGQSVTFQISNATSVQVSLRSVDGKTVTVNGKNIGSATEMYYEITGTNGVFTIVNQGEGILGIGNVKLPEGATVIDPSEIPQEARLYSLRMALAVEPDQSEEEQPAVFEPATFERTCRSVNVLGRKLVTVSVVTSNDVAYITVNGQKVNAWNNGLSWIYQPDTLRFTFTDLLKRGESKTYEIVAYNADGVASAVYTVQG